LKKGFSIAVALAVVLMMAAPVFSADTKDKVGLGVRGGIFFSGGEWKLGPMGGAEIKFGVHKNVAIGLVGMYGHTKGGMLEYDANSILKMVSTDEDSLKLRIRHHIIEAAGWFNITPDAPYNFYLTAGVGVDSWRVRDKSGNKVDVADTAGNAFEFSDQALTLMFGAGVEYFIIPEFSAGLALRYHLLTSVFSQFKDEKDIGDDIDAPSGVFEIGVGVTAYLGKCDDDDKDGVCNESDQCPETPKHCIVDSVGCPIDTDGDGVCDGVDKCMDTPKGCKVDMSGCQTDADGDGVCDGLDKCPDTPKIAKVDANGCPIDTDKDGVADYLDKCPDTPRGCKVDADGCPLDEDGDGVCDGLDECPKTPAGLKVDAKGCPTDYKIDWETVLVGVTFSVNSAVLTDKDKATLDQTVDALKAFPHVRLEIQGHTDSSGAYDKNVELSQKRAQSVADYFVAKGAEAGRFDVKGYGPDKPKVDNSTAENRAKNRRVELKRLN
jgi:outer membrane protein OmpA-like peptidoglycan-associated protein